MKNKGFAIIELTVYMGLFSIIMAGLIIIVFQLILSSEKLCSKDTTQEEINFVFKKLDWALTGASSINSEHDGIKITKDGDDIYIKTEDKILKYCDESCITMPSNYFPITSVNVEVESFTYDSLTNYITLNINGIIIKYTKYLRL